MSFPKHKKPRKKAIRISKIIRDSVIQRDKGICQICGKQATQLHHILYKSYGGANISQNLICLCNEDHLRVHAYGKKWFPRLLKLQQRHYTGLTKEMLKK
jgi:5-methylcytosine-specific restriction endonuclease McrA